MRFLHVVLLLWMSMVLMLCINGGNQSLAPSPFQKRVLFLISQPACGGDVEQFVSQCGTFSKRQHNLDDNIRHLRFMVQFHGDIDGRPL